MHQSYWPNHKTIVWHCTFSSNTVPTYVVKSFWIHVSANFSDHLKDFFLRALREVAPEMELFLENHGQYIKIFVIKLIYIQSCTFRHFTKKCILKEYVIKIFATFFCRNSLPNTTLVTCKGILRRFDLV